MKKLIKMQVFVKINKSTVFSNKIVSALFFVGQILTRIFLLNLILNLNSVKNLTKNKQLSRYDSIGKNQRKMIRCCSTSQ
jgi:hypothetical protein